MGDNNNNNYEGVCCNESQYAFIFLYLGYFLLVILTQGSIIVKPLRLLATFIHEMSHAIVCWLTCGSVTGIEVYNNAGGVTKYRGGCRCCVAAAGYLGEAFWGMVFVVLSGGRKTSTFAGAGLIGAMLVSLCYSPNRCMVILNLGYALVTGAFIYLEWRVFSPLLEYVILLYGVFIGTYAILDIWNHLIIRVHPESDAYALYEESNRCCFPRCVGIQWFITAVVLQIAGIWVAIVLMSEACADAGWSECVFHSKFGFDVPALNWDKANDWKWDGDWKFWGNNP